jgi:2'-hydroxyisoflavone reductase
LAVSVDILILGGTAWLGREIARQALERGHAVTCVARGESGEVAAGATLIAADRSKPDAYDGVPEQDWDAVFEVSWQPGFVRGALDAFGARAKHWTYVSSGNAYESFDTAGADESAPLRAATDQDVVDREQYGEAKVACEQASQAELADRLLVVRSGLIAGPGDVSDRVGAWVARFARAVADGAPVLVPDSPEQPVQAIDVRDLAAWVVASGEAGGVGTYNASGPVLRFADLIAMSRTVAGHTGPVELVDSDWLADQGVEEFMGPESVALWMHDPDWAGFSARDTVAVRRAGLTARPLEETLTDTLPWERELGLDRARKAGLSAARERELLAAWAAR